MIDQAMLRNSTNGDGSHGGGPIRPVQSVRSYSYSEYMKYPALNFRGTEGVVGLSRWYEKMESVFHISSCAIENQVDKYIDGFLDNTHGNVMSARPKTLDEAIELANDLMDQRLHTYAEKQTESKRKFDNNQAQQLFKRQNVAQDYTVGTGERKDNQRTITSYECGKQGHYKSDCLELKNQNHGNQAEGIEARGMVLELPQQLSRVHNTFHVSNLKKYLSDESLVILLDELHVDDKLHFVEEPVEIMDRKIKQLKRSRIPIIKVRWNSKRGPEFTWEQEEKFKKPYPHLFTKTVSSSSN
nr:putative reverse transcriptase domain-containing protein [Tanacetum cinerariifolium]